MKKELLISAKFDTSDFDKSVERMQNRLKDLYAPSDMARAQAQTDNRLRASGTEPGRSSVSPEQAQRTAVQAKRQLDSFIKEEVRDQEKLVKMLSNRENKLKDLQAQQKSVVAGSKEELEIKKEIARIEEHNFRTREYYKEREQVINKAQDKKEDIGPNGESLKAAKAAAAAKEDQEEREKDEKKRTRLKRLATAGSIALIAGKLIEYNAGAQSRLEEARGSAVSNTVGKDMGAAYGGKSPFEAAWMPERSQASAIAKEKAEGGRTNDTMKIAAAVLAGVGATIATGGMAAIPILTGLATTGAAIGLSDRMREKTLSILPGKMGEDHKNKYEALIAGEQSKDFRKTLEDLKDQDPGKKLTLDKFEAERQANVGTQRQLGLSNQGFYGEGGFQQRGAQAGFMNDQMSGMSSQIMQAGGSARMGREADFGLKMERSGLTNAGSVLGTMSGSIQNPESTKRATIGIMSEAFKIGLDNSDYAEENRKFTQAAANIIGKSGASTEGDQDRLTQTLAQFMGERTNKGVEAAGGAYERFQERGSQLGGRRGAMRFQAARQDANLGKLDTGSLTELLGMRPEDLREDSSAARAFAKDAGFEGKDSVKQLQESLKKVNQGSRFLIPSNRSKAEKHSGVVNKYMQEKGLSKPQLDEMARRGELPPDVDYAYGKLQITTNQEEKGSLNASTAEAASGEFLPGAGGAGDKGAASAKLENKGGRIEDTFNSKAAEGADLARKNFMALLPALQNIGAAADELVSKLAPVAGALSDTAAARRAGAPKGNAYGTDLIGPILQPQANKPKGP